MAGDLRLGFGTATVPPGCTRAAYERLIETALDAGVSHIDTARMYGYGETEHWLGDVVRRRRSEIYLVSKAGIAPPSVSLPARALRRASAELAKRSIRAPMPAPLRAYIEPTHHKFKPEDVVASLETSLKALKTDHLDAFLLHECAPQDITDALLETLERLKREGKVGAIGTASAVEPTKAIARTHADAFSIWQFPSSVWRPAIDTVRPPPGSRVITHSILGDSFHALMRRIEADAGFRASMSAALDLDAGDRAALGGLILQEALAANANGAVLFSSANPANIARNAEIAARAPDQARIEKLRAFALKAGSPAAASD